MCFLILHEQKSHGETIQCTVLHSAFPVSICTAVQSPVSSALGIPQCMIIISTVLRHHRCFTGRNTRVSWRDHTVYSTAQIPYQIPCSAFPVSSALGIPQCMIIISTVHRHHRCFTGRVDVAEGLREELHAKAFEHRQRMEQQRSEDIRLNRRPAVSVDWSSGEAHATGGWLFNTEGCVYYLYTDLVLNVAGGWL